MGNWGADRVFSLHPHLPWTHSKKKAECCKYTMASDGKSPQKSVSASFLTSQEPLEIFDKIWTYLNMADFWVFRQVCKRYYQVENLQRRFNINILLRPFVSNPQIFRSELGKHDTLILPLSTPVSCVSCIKEEHQVRLQDVPECSCIVQSKTLSNDIRLRYL